MGFAAGPFSSPAPAPLGQEDAPAVAQGMQGWPPITKPLLTNCAGCGQEQAAVRILCTLCGAPLQAA